MASILCLKFTPIFSLRTLITGVLHALNSDYPCSELPFTLECDKVELASEPETRLNSPTLSESLGKDKY
jgi:hypothetical protein